jgi:toxin ParE1/3/4
MPRSTKRGSGQMKVVWTNRAIRDLEEIGDFIARDSSAASNSWVERLIERAGDTALLPMASRVVPEFARVDVCEVFLRASRIVFRVESHRIVVLTVFQAHRQLGPFPDED